MNCNTRRKIEVFFIFDCTYRTELMTTLGHIGVIAAGAWVNLAAIKLILLVWVFRLKVSFTAIIIPILAAGPHALERSMINKEFIYLGAIWYGAALLICLSYFRPKVVCKVHLDEWGQTVLRRVQKAVFAMWTGFYIFHLLTQGYVFNVSFTPALAAPLLLCCFLFKNERWAWLGGLTIMPLTAEIPAAVTPVAVLVGMVYGMLAWQKRRSRCFLAMVLCFYLAV